MISLVKGAGLVYWDDETEHMNLSPLSSVLRLFDQSVTRRMNFLQPPYYIPYWVPISLRVSFFLKTRGGAGGWHFPNHTTRLRWTHEYMPRTKISQYGSTHRRQQRWIEEYLETSYNDWVKTFWIELFLGKLTPSYYRLFIVPWVRCTLVSINSDC